MRIVKSGTNLHLIVSFKGISKVLGTSRGRLELHRGVTDAGRKVKTRVQRAVKNQMALKPGNYGSYVVAGTRGVPKKDTLSFEIYGIKGGAKIETYKGLSALKSGGAPALQLNAGRKAYETGVVKSDVWNKPRVFKRSFVGTNGGYYALRPATRFTSKRAPKAFWTFGHKVGQPRTGDGRFAPSGVKYGKVRTLFGPSLMKEIPKDDSLAVFLAEGPKLLEFHVGKRLTKLMRF